MKIAAIISEYNPFHNGHRFHIDCTRHGFEATHVVPVMSGNFTQRGDVAVFDKFSRARMALESGVDLVLELPVAASLGSAEQFAAGAVGIVNALNCVDLLSFGSEAGDIDLLSETAGAVEYAVQTDEFLGFMRRGSTYPVALTKTIEKYYDDIINETLAAPNNTLAVEYLRALSRTGSSVAPVTIKRHGAGHDSAEIGDNIASASQIRKLLLSGESVSEFTPVEYPQNYADISRLETAILYKLRTMTADEIRNVPNVLHGLENRIAKAAKAAKNLPELMFLIKTKRYTLARLRRIILCCLLGITKTHAKTPPQYIRILGMNQKGREILAATDSTLPIDASLSALMRRGDNCRKQGALEVRTSDIYGLAYEKPLPCGLELTSKPIIY
ncbi:MAG: nucleotidyltransferase family protein [Oscillospiraceae bacterium]|nr:nucleotidyltransferase family protein [Oscillospiraceae bacterium]